MTLRKKNPIFSVVIPIFNAEKYIVDTVRSVLRQTFKDFEVILVDDFSTDNTPAICGLIAEQNKNVKYIRTARNYGCPGGPRNLGVRHADGEYVAFLDADDLWHENKLEAQLLVIEKYRSDFVSSEMQVFKQKHFYDCQKKMQSLERVTKIKYWDQALNYQTPTSSVVVKKSIMEANPFQEGLNFKAREDIDCWLRIHSLISSSYKIQAPLIGYRLSDQQISGNKFDMLSRTYYCYRHTAGLPFKLMGLLPVVLTVSHAFNSIFKRYTGRSV